MDVNGSQPLRTALSTEIARIRLVEHGQTELANVGRRQIRRCAYCKAEWPCHMLRDAHKVLKQSHMTEEDT